MASQPGPRSLKRMCIAVALRNLSGIVDVGELPFDAARPLLIKMENPEQLHALETNCPQLAAEPGQMSEIWRRLLNKKFPRWAERGYVDLDDASLSWYDIYNAVKEAVDQDTAAATAHLQEQFAGFRDAKAGKTTRIVNNRALLRKLPGGGAAAAGATGRHRAAGPGSFTFGGGSRTAMATGQSVMRRVRREAKEISKVSALSKPTGALRAAQGQITKAPYAMVHDHIKARNPDIIIRAPKKRTSEVSSEHSAAEARLVALKNGGTPTKSTSANTKVAVAKDNINLVRPVMSKMDAAVAATAAAATRPGQHPRPPKRHRHDDDIIGAYEELNDDDLFGDEPTKKVRRVVGDHEPAEDDDDLFGGPIKKTAKAGLSVADLERPAARPVKATATAAKPKLGGDKVGVRVSPPPIRRKAAVDVFMRPKKR